MPEYNWKCIKCDVIWEVFQSMTEHSEHPPKCCPKCDPDRKGERTLEQVILPGDTPKFIVKGEGAFYPDKMQ